MKRLAGLLVLVILLSGCGGWGGYEYKSDLFEYKFVFPNVWEVMDRGDSKSDHLIAHLPDNYNAEIKVDALPVSPDLRANEIYLRFMDGGDDASIYMDFEVVNQGTISAKNLEGRYITVKFLKDGEPMQGIRAKFLGFKYTLEVKATVPEDDYILRETEFRKMISMIQFKD